MKINCLVKRPVCLVRNSLMNHIRGIRDRVYARRLRVNAYTSQGTHSRGVEGFAAHCVISL